MVAMTQRFYSTMRMRYAGRVLGQWRNRAGLTGDIVAERLDWPRSKISKLENASQSITPSDVISLATVYGVPAAERNELVGEAQRANERSWWQSFEDITTTKEFYRYVDLESEAKELINFEIDLIPDLLRTEEYARTVARTFTPRPNAAEIKRRLALQKRRQARLIADNPLHLDAIVTEVALRQLVGGTDVMRNQLKHLSRITHLPNVSIRVIPFSAGAYAAMGRPFAILRFNRSEWPDVAYEDNLTTSTYVDAPHDVARYSAVYSHLSDRALRKDDTLAAIDRLVAAL